MNNEQAHNKAQDLKLTEVHAGAMLLLDKPLTWTSFQAINKVKYLLKKPKIGHSGTLDPLASGLLIVCTGKWTKKLTDLIGLNKEYTGTIMIGATTPTFDLESSPTNQKAIDHITNEVIEHTRQKFVGNLLQYPPIHSAIKIDGKRAYELARDGKDVEIKPRSINILEFEITRIALPEIDFRVACTSGTYLRSLANDFGAALGVGGYLSALRRTKIGEHNVEDAYQLEDLIEVFSKKQ
jgi:tRNA pseudouridine55 synthase